MSADKRSVATDALETLGTIIDPSQKRDAIHLAVEPVVAGEMLRPGHHIQVVKGIARRTATGQGQGIVDPFLPGPVKPGEWFWFVMYPRQVHSLRHVWTHPDFPDEAGTSAPDKTASELWLRKFCEGADCPSYETVMALISEGTLPSNEPEYYADGGHYSEDYLHFSGSDAHGEI